jgi:cellulose synthase/poly-beta-1,6-N-acetylglucosamine synthase-like glycosyltransferase
MAQIADIFAVPLLVYYVAVVAVFCVYGLHRYGQVWAFRRTGGLRTEVPEPDLPAALPPVTVQLPMFNERHVAQRIIEAACAIDYPRDLLEIQVLDDSTDESADVARRCCERLAGAGHDVKYLHRACRDGYKAGALAAGLETARGELIAIFDADFVPPPDCLRRTIGHFGDPGTGMVQMRWGHLNRDDSLLTRIQALCLDGHFVVEQVARARTGRWFNFNGTAGVWRRACIDDAGGWRHDTLTEDTDLSYRAQLAGWRFRYLPHVVCPAELPPSVSALMSQQHRWSKGLAQNAIKLLPTILRSGAPLPTKVEAFFHLTSPVPYVALFVLALLATPALWVSLPATGIDALAALVLGLVCLGLGTFSACAFTIAAQAGQGRSIWSAALHVIPLMAIGVGVSLINTKAVLEAVMGRPSPFVRTPKFAGRPASVTDPAAEGRRRRVIPPGATEVALGLMLLAGLGLAAVRPATLVGLPFVLLFAIGFLMIGVPRMREWFYRRVPSSEAAKPRAVIAET